MGSVKRKYKPQTTESGKRHRERQGRHGLDNSQAARYQNGRQRRPVVDAFRPVPLDLDNAQIRLLKVVGKSTSGYIECILETFSFEPKDSNTAIPYRALSYTWGSKTPQYDIIINDKLFRVRKNLYKFLQVVAQDRSACDYYYWIDQICIDQTDVSERNHIVSQMPDIYSMATEVIAWLGEAAGGSDRAMEILDDIKGKSGNELDHYRRCRSNLEDMEALTSLLERRYWNRLWILQELRLAKQTSLWCGQRAVKIRLNKALNSALHKTFFFGSIKARVARQLFLFVDHEIEYWTWAEAMERIGKQDCYDLRDRVFGLQGFVAPRYRIRVDYSWTTEHLLTEVLRMAVKQKDFVDPGYWMDMVIPTWFADALFGDLYSCYRLMTIEALWWSLMFSHLLEASSWWFVQFFGPVLNMAKTVGHRRLADAISERCDRSISKYLAQFWTELQRLGLLRNPDEGLLDFAVRVHKFMVKELDMTLRADIGHEVITNGFHIVRDCLQHRGEPSYTELLEATSTTHALESSDNKRLQTHVLPLWSGELSATGFRTRKQLRILSLDHEDLETPRKGFDEYVEEMLSVWSVPGHVNWWVWLAEEICDRFNTTETTSEGNTRSESENCFNVGMLCAQLQHS